MHTLELISDELHKQKKSQKQLCDHLGIKKSNFSDWKKGKSVSYKKYLPEISNFLNVSIDYLAKTDIPQHETFVTYKDSELRAQIEVMSKIKKSVALKQFPKPEIIQSAMEETLLQAFRASTDAGRTAIMEAALKAKMANEGSDVAIAKENK